MAVGVNNARYVSTAANAGWCQALGTRGSAVGRGVTAATVAQYVSVTGKVAM